MGKRNESKKKHRAAAAIKTLKGKLDITRSGMGFVIVPEQETDVLIRPVILIQHSMAIWSG